MKLLNLLLCLNYVSAIGCPCPKHLALAAGSVCASVCGMSMAKINAARIPISIQSIPFMVANVDGLRPKEMTFEHPKTGQIYYTNNNYDIVLRSSGLLGGYGRISKVWILNADFKKVAQVASESEFKIMHDKRGGKNTGYLSITIPGNIENGRYYLKYQSSWSWLPNTSRFAALSNPFFIMNDYSSSDEDLKKIPPSKEPSSFTIDNCPRELLYMYQKIPSMREATHDLVDGVIETPAVVLNGVQSFVKSPTDSNPIKLKNKWADYFRRRPFKAIGTLGSVAAGAVRLYRYMNPLTFTTYQERHREFYRKFVSNWKTNPQNSDYIEKAKLLNINVENTRPFLAAEEKYLLDVFGHEEKPFYLKSI